MFRKCIRCLLTLLAILQGHASFAQLCTTPGQTPVTAVLVCSSASVSGNTPTFCGSTAIPVPCNDGFNYSNSNPYFFRINCFAAGSLGFSIVPDDALADYNWQLFDITNRNPNDIFNVASAFEACNWSPEPGSTGASPQGTQLVICANSGNIPYSSMPQVLQGHTYLLMVSNQSQSPDGYQLTFSGGTASITDPLQPHLQSARTSCDGSSIILRTNKRVLCGSIASDGSDFILNTGANITGAVPGNCNTLFGTDSIIIFIDQPLPNGNYILQMNQGSDGNTLSDYCDQVISVTETLSFTVSSLVPTPMDSIRVSACAPASLELVFNKPMRCSSIASDGSDFVISGPQPVAVSLSGLTCSNTGLTSVIRLQLAPAITLSGMYTIQLRSGNDGNTLVDECGLQTPAGSSLGFRVQDGVSATFTYSLPASCDQTKFAFAHNTPANAAGWSWNFGNGVVSNLPNPTHIFPVNIQQTVSLVVTNGNCSDTARQTIRSGTKQQAGFIVPDELCPGELFSIRNTSKGNFNRWNWDFGNGIMDATNNPPAFYYPFTGNEQTFTLLLVAQNTGINCSDTVRKVVRVAAKCAIVVPTAFSPNNDGLNDYLFPLNAMQTTDLVFRVYNRDGQLVFQSTDPGKKWNGTLNGIQLNTGVYAWILSYKENGKQYFLKGTSLLLR